MRDTPAAPTDSLRRFAETKLADLDARGRLRQARAVTPSVGGRIDLAGKYLINVSSNDYLGLARHPKLIAAAVDAAERYGTGAGASPLVTGRHPLIASLETRLAQAKGREAALVFAAGYQTALGVIPALMGAADLILIDEWAHNCLHMGAKLSGARVCRFAHNDGTAAQRALVQHRAAARHALIVTDTVFSMDGDLGDLPALAQLARDHDAWLLADDAHGTGVVDVPGLAEVDLLTGTLSKALGAQGGFVCADAPVVELLRNRARSHVYSTALAPPAAAAALAALTLIAGEPSRTDRPLKLARRLTRRLGLPEPASPIVPVLLGTEAKALAAQAALEKAGYLAVAIRPPTVPNGTARLRLALSAALDETQVDGLAAALQPILTGACP